MVLELGPCPTDDVLGWLKFARRIVAELRTVEGAESEISDDVVELWSRIFDDWSAIAVEASNQRVPFRWDRHCEPEVAEFLLHGLDQCLHSPTVMSWVSPDEAETQRSFTMLVVRSLVDSLVEEGHSCQHYADQILASLAGVLPD